MGDNKVFNVGDRVKWRISGAIEEAWFIGKVEEVCVPGTRPYGVARDLFYSVSNFTYIVSRVSTHGHTSRYYLDEGVLHLANEGVDALMTRGEALAEAKRRWGNLGGVFDRKADGSKAVRERFGDIPRYWVGMNNPALRTYGNGDTWEEAFLAADCRDGAEKHGD